MIQEGLSQTEASQERSSEATTIPSSFREFKSYYTDIELGNVEEFLKL